MLVSTLAVPLSDACVLDLAAKQRSGGERRELLNDATLGSSKQLLQLAREPCPPLLGELHASVNRTDVAVQL
jgi:hypothetical protein